jgi:hypothetical protein
MKLLILMFALAAIHDDSAQKKARIAAALAEQDQRMPCATTHITNSFISNFIDIDGEPYALYCKDGLWAVDEAKTKALQQPETPPPIPPIPKPIKWRLSTPEEIHQREIKGWGCDRCIGDPPCTLGSDWGSADWDLEEKDCGLTDGQGNFEYLVVVSLRKIEKTKTKPYFRTHVWRRCQMTQEQYYSLASGPYHDIKIDEVVEQCRQNKLPKWPTGQ